MTKEIFKKFKSNILAYLYCEELDVRILHSEFEHIIKIYRVQEHSNSIKIIEFYMTEHMILKAYKKDSFTLGELQVGA